MQSPLAGEGAYGFSVVEAKVRGKSSSPAKGSPSASLRREGVAVLSPVQQILFHTHSLARKDRRFIILS
ncbi:hypothetical protein AADEFJLK_00025 [Methylovulum psychrotolerans]|uniref:Uncharacterized protein n=1 Tax=Methylovulum psychrotolerans TaxID=1704499 RepID=A0A2S5CQF4_9GAMM|nr:hypothetical protein AADEFJLK_00025 [Methylovulum psychrotolerans]